MRRQKEKTPKPVYDPFWVETLELSRATPGEKAWHLIRAGHPKTIRGLEKLLGKTQAEVVDRMIERSCWSENVPEFVGGKGTPAQRRAALLAAEERLNAVSDISDDDIPF